MSRKVCRELACPKSNGLHEVDNTVKECKNNTVMKMMAWLLQFTGLMMSRVGHTHSTLGSLLRN